MATSPSPSFIIFSSSIFYFFLAATVAALPGSWKLLQTSTGVSAMHMQLLPTDRVIIFDRTDFGPSNISLLDGKCREDPHDLALKKDCTAHSIEYDVVNNKIRPLTVLTDVWCSSGALMPDGNLIQSGGFNDGDHVVRVYDTFCGKNCDWKEIPGGLINRRWYATNHILPDGKQIVIGGRQSPNYEFYPKSRGANQAYNMPFLSQTNDPNHVENNLYPFVFLNPDGNLFIFANNRAILFDYAKNQVVKTFPEIVGGEPRNYPSIGSAVLLPLRIVQGGVAVVEVLVCGGAPKGSYVNAAHGIFDGALDTCGRIRISDPNSKWAMETMPFNRVMGDMVLLPNGNTVLIINGGSSGTAGWELGRNPVLHPVIYRPNNDVRSRFEVQNPSTIPRMYHSTAILVRDGRVLVGGSNPHIAYDFKNVLFPTELRFESFSPFYLDRTQAGFRPKITSPLARTSIRYGEKLVVQFTVQNKVNVNQISVTMVAPSFTTHAHSMNQRLLVLDGGNTAKGVGKLTYEVNVVAPPSGNIAPTGYYMLFVVHQDIPSEGIWVLIQ